ncbi:MAG: NAD(P) transhydrogenase subunit alpha [Alphaproteobacteria bacterium]|nr:NAD(P) transhydrogenase subunit alpha [Alphaproteobacteria bacterium]
MQAQEKAVSDSAAEIALQAQDLADRAADLAIESTNIAGAAMHGQPFLITGLTVFILACFVGYYVVWRVTPALHSPLMGITNAISSVIIVGAVIAVGAAEATGLSKLLAFLGVTLASVNIFGGFIITRRMLHMFKKKGV